MKGQTHNDPTRAQPDGDAREDEKPDRGQRIVRLEASNFKRLRAVEITPDGAMVIIRGKNGAGKSSVLDSIQAALGGKRLSPAKPVREGEERAEIITELDGLTIRRTFHADGGGSLVVTASDGSRVKSPQAVLDRLVGSLSFDPLAFSKLEPRKRLDVVRSVSGVDVGPLDGRRLDLFEKRTDINREAKRLEAQLAGVPRVKDAPAEPLSVSEIAAELETAQAKHTARAEAERASDGRGAEVSAAARRYDVAIERADALRAQLETILVEAEGLASDVQAAKVAHAEAFALSEAADAEDLPAIAPIRERLAGVEEINAGVRRNAERDRISTALDTKRTESLSLSADIEAVDAEKRAAISGAELPVEGLSWTDEGVTLDGLPFEQCSSAEKLRASVALAIAMNPALRVLLVREGSLLDEDGLRTMAELAAEHDAQVWIEVVGDGESGIVIEDGAVRTASDDR